jgi:hypothetical protein
MNKPLAYYGIILKVVGLYQIATGLFMIYEVSKLIFRYGIYPLRDSLIWIAPFVLLCFFAGINLFRTRSSLRIAPTLLNQALQIFQIKAFGFGFIYYAGIYLAVGFLGHDSLHFDWPTDTFGFQCFRWFSSDEKDQIFLMNIVAVLLFSLVIFINKEFTLISGTVSLEKIGDSGEMKSKHPSPLRETGLR